MTVLVLECPDGELPDYHKGLGDIVAEAGGDLAETSCKALLLGKGVSERVAAQLRAINVSEFVFCDVSLDPNEIVSAAQSVLTSLNDLIPSSSRKLVLAAERSVAGQVLSLLSGMTLSGLARNVQSIRHGRVFSCRDAAARVVYDLEISTPLAMATVDVGLLVNLGVIVAGGGAFTEEGTYLDSVASVAEDLQALCLASRGAVDTGVVGREKVVGLSARQVIADTYLSLGVSGAPQHMHGVQSCDFVAAVNLDPNAAIFRYADVGLVADAAEFAEQLHKILKTDK